MTATNRHPLTRRNLSVNVFLLAALILLASTMPIVAQQSETLHYEYDRLNRVTKVTYDSSGASIIYTYDPAGNRTAITVNGTNLAPVLTSVYPESVAAGTHGFTFGVNGNHLINGAAVKWNGSIRTATYFGPFVTIDLNDADLATPGNVSVTVVNPAPGALESNPLTFTVTPGPTSLRIDSVDRLAGRTSGAQQIRLTGWFANLSTVTMGGTSASWAYTNGSSDVSVITVTTPPHSVGTVQIDLTPVSGPAVLKANAFAYLPTVFTDDTILVRQTTSKAQHVLELRQAVDALRVVAGLAPVPWTDATLTPSASTIKAVHIQELRSYLEDAANRLGYPTGSYTDPSLGAGVVVKRIYLEELRQRIRTIAQ